MKVLNKKALQNFSLKQTMKNYSVIIFPSILYFNEIRNLINILSLALKIVLCTLMELRKLHYSVPKYSV